MAAQEQALQTWWFISRIEKGDVCPKYRLCDVEIKTVRHLSAGYTKFSKGPYKRRHDQMGLRVYWELYWKYGIGYANNWFKEVPNTVQRS